MMALRSHWESCVPQCGQRLDQYENHTLLADNLLLEVDQQQVRSVDDLQQFLALVPAPKWT